VQKDLKEVGKDLERERKLLKKLKRQSSSLLQTMAQFDHQLEAAQTELVEAEDRLVGLEQNLAQHREQRERAGIRLKACRRRLGLRLRMLYKMGEVGWLNLIFDAESMSEGIQRYTSLQRMARADAELIAETRRLQELIDVSERKIIEQKTYLRKQKERVLERQERAELARSEKAKALELLQKEEALHARAIAELKKARGRLAKMVSVIEGKASRARGFASWRGRLPSPVSGGRIEVPFGLRVDPRFKTKTKHQGVDIRAKKGAKVKAVYPGKVAFAKPFQGYGLLVILDHGGGYYTLYAHLGRFMVNKGDKVTRGQPVGTLGDTGSLKGPYLYFEVREKGRAADPAKWVRF
jgi:septal ring factor EnvC (AmiA/AmiB activator)